MSGQIDMSLLLTVSPSAVERVHRLQFTLDLLRSRTPRSDVIRRVRDTYQISHVHAWRVVRMASELLVD